MGDGRNNVLKPVTVEKNMKYAEYEENVKKQWMVSGTDLGKERSGR